MSHAAPLPGRIGYVVSRFPQLSETFVLREMSALRELGHDIVLYPLITQSEAVVHQAAQPWLAQARRLPHASVAVVVATLAAVVRSPAVVAGIVWTVLREHRREPVPLVKSLVLLPTSIHLARLVQRDGVAHLHAHFATFPLLAAWVVHRLTGVPYSVTVHAHDLFISTAMLRAKLDGASFVVAISEYNRRYLVERVDPGLAGRTHVVHCGVSLDAYSAERSAPEPGPLSVLAVGTLQRHKGHTHLVEACRLLGERGVDVRCSIVGEGAERPALERQIAESGLAGRVTLLGARDQDEVAQLLRQAGCFVQPSIVDENGQMEGIPVALMEALASGLPAVATDLSGVPELVRDQETGMLVRPGDPAALADALQAVHRDPDRAAALGRAGRVLVEEEFDLYANARRLGSLLAGQGRGALGAGAAA